jgi:hypothetical protein
VEVRCVLYTVPSRLIGRQLELRLHHDRILGYLGNHQVVDLPRIRVTEADKRRGRCINYRHVIEGLRRKPRAFIYCTWQDDLLPTTQFRELWAKLKAQFDLDTAAVLIVEALYISATQNKEGVVPEYLEQELKAQTLTLKRLKQQFNPDCSPSFPPLTIEQHPLSSYDQLFESSPRSHDSTESLPEPRSASEAAPPVPYSDSLGIYGAPSGAGAMVLLEILAGIMRAGIDSTQRSTVATSTHRSSTSQRKKFFQL